MTRALAVRLSGWLDPQRPSQSELADAIAAPFAGAPSTSRRAAVVEVDTPPVQRRMLRDLPPMTARDLRRLVNHQASRFFRMPDSGLVTDAAWLSKGRQQRVALAVAIDSRLADDLLAASNQVGIKVVDIVPTIAPRGLRLTLLPAEERTRRGRAEWRVMARVTAVTCGLAIALTGLVTWRRATTAAAVAAELARLEGPALQVRQASQRLDTVVAMIEAIRRARAAAGLLASRIATVARSLPDSSVLSSLTIAANGAGQLSGLAAEPFLVTAQIQRAAGNRTVRLEGSPTPEAAAGRNWFRFLIRLDSDSTP